MTTSELSNAELRRRIAELEAENNQLHDRLNVVINDREHFVSLMNEARHWARLYRRRYLHVKRYVMELFKTPCNFVTEEIANE